MISQYVDPVVWRVEKHGRFRYEEGPDEEDVDDGAKAASRRGELFFFPICESDWFCEFVRMSESVAHC